MRKPADKAGWRPAEWYGPVGISRSAFYDLPPEMQPKSVKFGAGRIITETPREYLSRIAVEVERFLSVEVRRELLRLADSVDGQMRGNGAAHPDE